MSAQRTPVTIRAVGYPGACDFCSGRPIVADFPCVDFVLDLPPVGGTLDRGSAGAWGACVRCVEDVCAGRTGPPMARAVDHLLRTGGIPASRRSALLAQVGAVHRGFWDNRLPGPPKPCGRGL
jgi:hypothetical protein